MNFIEVYFCELSNNFYDNHLLTLISDDKKELLKNKTVMESKLSIYSDLFVRYLICNKYHLHNSELRFTKNKYGKPYLLNNQNVFYNISHTNNALVVALSKEEVGIDIEKFRSIDLKIANRFFAASEQDYIFSNEHKTEAFFEIWTKKEAFTKYKGKGLLLPMASFNVLEKTNSCFIDSIIIQKFIVSLCLKNSNSNSTKIQNVEEREIEEFFTDGSLS